MPDDEQEITLKFAAGGIHEYANLAGAFRRRILGAFLAIFSFLYRLLLFTNRF